MLQSLVKHAAAGKDESGSSNQPACAVADLAPTLVGLLARVGRPYITPPQPTHETTKPRNRAITRYDLRLI